ncbi:hypothetical protein X777_07131 [Ooceraea biroi]|uniref:Uncharacterized protein n=1 Tax=Ooceraea biroi TaxID=2015173 RepID=A0A026W9N0_OOCBI|nr:hypothetical protein X777_07131 [Ooceraea biroi]
MSYVMFRTTNGDSFIEKYHMCLTTYIEKFGAPQKYFSGVPRNLSARGDTNV